jgi:hypothetical protein
MTFECRFLVSSLCGVGGCDLICVPGSCPPTAITESCSSVRVLSSVETALKSGELGTKSSLEKKKEEAIFES